MAPSTNLPCSRYLKCTQIIQLNLCVCIILAQNYRPCGVQMLLLSKKFKFTISLTRHFEVILSLGRLQVTIVRTPHVDKVARLG